MKTRTITAAALMSAVMVWGGTVQAAGDPPPEVRLPPEAPVSSQDLHSRLQSLLKRIGQQKHGLSQDEAALIDSVAQQQRGWSDVEKALGGEIERQKRFLFKTEEAFLKALSHQKMAWSQVEERLVGEFKSQKSGWSNVEAAFLREINLQKQNWSQVEDIIEGLLRLTPKPGQIVSDPVTGMPMVWVPGNCYEMGAQASEKGRSPDEGPLHKVCLKGFWMGRYEVTNAQFRKFKQQHDSKAVVDKQGTPHSLNEEAQPAASVSWKEAKAFAEWLTDANNGKSIYRLPTEAEWEYAARGGTQGRYYWGNDELAACDYANVNDNSFNRVLGGSVEYTCDDGFAGSAPVGRYQPNGFGLYDMIGNVSEWVSDWHHPRYYADSPTWNPGGPSNGKGRVFRGGNWHNFKKDVGSSRRKWGGDEVHGRTTKVYKTPTIGFRLVREAD